MSCRRYRELLSRYVDDALSQRERGDLLANIAGCAGCASARARLRQQAALIGRLPASEPAAWVRAAVLASTHRPGAARPRWLPATAAGVAAAQRLTIGGRDWLFIPARSREATEPGLNVLIGNVGGAGVHLEPSLPLEDFIKVAESLR